MESLFTPVYGGSVPPYKRNPRRASTATYTRWVKDAVAAAYVAILLDYRAGRLPHPKAEAVYCATSLLYTILYAGAGDPRSGIERVRAMSGWILDGVAAARATILGLYGVEGRPAWETLREFMEGRLARHWAAQGLVEALEKRRVRRMLYAKWMGDPTSIGVRMFNTEVDELLEKLEERIEALETLPSRPVEAGKVIYREARRLVEQTPRFVEKVSRSVKKMMLEGL